MVIPCDIGKWISPLWEIHFGEMLVYKLFFLDEYSESIVYINILTYSYCIYIIIVLSMVLQYLAVPFWSFGWLGVVAQRYANGGCKVIQIMSVRNGLIDLIVVP